MAKVEAFELHGYDLWFNSDDHLPPHFHVEKKGGAWEIKVHFLREPDEMCEVVWPKTPKKKGQKPQKSEVRVIAEAAEAHRAELLEEWEAAVKVKHPGPGR